MEAGSERVQALLGLARSSGWYELNGIYSAYEHARRLAAGQGIELPSGWEANRNLAHAARHHGGDVTLTVARNTAREAFEEALAAAGICPQWAGTRDDDWQWVGRVKDRMASTGGDGAAKGERFQQIVDGVKADWVAGGRAAKELPSSVVWRWWSNLLAKKRQLQNLAQQLG